MLRDEEFIMFECDGCQAQVDDDEKYVVRLPRPSDPTDMCAVLWFCTECGEPQAKPGVCMTEAGWDEWIEDEGAKQGFLWLT